MHWSCAEPEPRVIDTGWKFSNIADTIILIKKAMDDFKPWTVNACWEALWIKIMKEGRGPLLRGPGGIITALAWYGGGDGLNDLDTEEMNSLISHIRKLTNTGLEELDNSSIKKEKISDCTLKKFSEIFQLAWNLKENILEYKPSWNRASKFKITHDGTASAKLNELKTQTQ